MNRKQNSVGMLVLFDQGFVFQLQQLDDLFGLCGMFVTGLNLLQFGLFRQLTLRQLSFQAGNLARHGTNLFNVCGGIQKGIRLFGVINSDQGCGPSFLPGASRGCSATSFVSVIVDVAGSAWRQGFPRRASR